jgi:hypothetical protein
VLVVTEAAIREMLAGGSPYGHGFTESTPPGAPFAYGPLALLWYLPALHDPGVMERLAGVVVLLALAVRGRLVGLAAYAVLPILLVSANDGANDTTAGLLILIAVLASLRWPVAGAALLALASAFKPYALAWLPGLIGFTGSVAPLLAFIVVSLVAWALPAVAWGPANLLWSFRQADGLHATPYYSLAYATSGMGLPQPAWQALRIGAGVLLAVLSLAWVRTAGAMVSAGILVFLATLFLGWWGTFAYLAAVAPLVCWSLDGWLSLEGGRVVWPGDPVRRLGGWLDARWPVGGRRHRTGRAVIEMSTTPR